MRNFTRCAEFPIRSQERCVELLGVFQKVFRSIVLFEMHFSVHCIAINATSISRRDDVFLSRTCREALLFDRTCEILYFPRRLRSIFSSSWRISRVLRPFVETELCTRCFFFESYQWSYFRIRYLSIYIFRLFIYLLVFFFPIFLEHSVYTFHSIFPCG